MSGEKDILSFDHGKNRIPEDKLMAYLEGKLTPDEQYEVEQWLAEEGMESDALEGLKTMAPDETRHSVNKLNHGLRKNLHSKKRKRRPMNANTLSWIAIAVILMLVVLAYIVIRKSL